MPCNCKNNKEKEDFENKIKLIITDIDTLYIPVKTILSVKFCHETNNTSSASCCIYGNPLINGGEVTEEEIIKAVSGLGEKLIKNNPKLGEVTSFEINKSINIA